MDYRKPGKELYFFTFVIVVAFVLNAVAVNDIYKKIGKQRFFMVRDNTLYEAMDEISESDPLLKVFGTTCAAQLFSVEPFNGGVGNLNLFKDGTFKAYRSANLSNTRGISRNIEIERKQNYVIIQFIYTTLDDGEDYTVKIASVKVAPTDKNYFGWQAVDFKVEKINKIKITENSEIQK